MDFFQFLQNSKDDNKVKNTKQTNNTQNTNLTTQTNHTNQTNQENQEVEIYKNIRRGDMVKIIGVKNSVLNSYKGYIGEIRDYKRDQDYALIFLHCINSHTIIKFPLTHFVKISPYRCDN